MPAGTPEGKAMTDAKPEMQKTANTPVIRLTNTKTRKKEVFTPIDATNVRMYVCGP
ncbi:MAG: hypothetical protein ACJAX2_002910, partial [Celeribacter sp.]